MAGPRKMIVVGAHPDDCCLGAAGFSVLLRQAGWQVVFLTITDGELGGEPAVRLEEERVSARMLDVELDFGHLPDGFLTGPGTMKLLEAKLEQHRPHLILTHAPQDSHSDHRVVSDSLVSAARRHSSVLFYEGPSTMHFAPSLKVCIESTWDLKVKALLAHRSQRERVRTVEWAQVAGQHRGWPTFGGMCEAFVPVRMDLNFILQAPSELVLPSLTEDCFQSTEPAVTRSE